MNSYEQQANSWAEKWGVIMTARHVGHMRHFPDDSDTRDVYEITLLRGERRMVIKFGQSLSESGYSPKFSDGPYWRKLEQKKTCPPTRTHTPTMYDVIACIQKTDPGTFDDFRGDFGFDTDSRRALDTYMAVQREAADFARLCGGDSVMREEAEDIS